MRNFADLAYLMPTSLPTIKLLIAIDLPTLPTFNARARIREKKTISIRVLMIKKILHVREK